MLLPEAFNLLWITSSRVICCSKTGQSAEYCSVSPFIATVKYEDVPSPCVPASARNPLFERCHYSTAPPMSRKKWRANRCLAGLAVAAATRLVAVSSQTRGGEPAIVKPWTPSRLVPSRKHDKLPPNNKLS